MRRFNVVLTRWRALWRREVVIQDIDEELRLHIEMETQTNMERGMTAEEARHHALQSFGNVPRIRDLAYEIRGGGMLETLWQDLSFGARMLLKKPGFTAVAVLALALGIGANTAIFSVVKAVLLNPLPYRNPDQLVWIWESNPSNDIPQEPASLPNYDDWRNQARSFSGMAAFAQTALTLTSKGEPERISGTAVTANFFSVLSVEPALGRSFLPEENSPGKNRVVILSNSLWQRRFGGNSNVVGQTLTLNGNPYTVIGIAPAGFKNPAPAQRHPAEMWVPLTINLEQAQRRSDFLNVVARLNSGVGLEQARAEMQTITSRLAQQYPETNTGWGVTIIPLHERLVGDTRLALLVLMGIVGFLLLIACANMANLLLARSAARQQEIAIRTALGAGRRRLVRQLLTESVLLALSGGALGALLAMWSVEALVALRPVDLPRLDEVGLDWKVLTFTLAVSLITGVVFGLLPALYATSPNLTELLKEGGRSATEGVRGSRLRSSLVISEIALAMMLLIGAGLMIRSFLRLQEVDPGFNPEGILAIDLSLPASKYREDRQIVAFFHQLTGRLSTLPGVEGAAVVSALPLAGGDITTFSIEGRPEPPPSQVIDAEYRVVSPGYFTTMGIPLVRGSGFTEHHTAEVPAVTIINETMARQFWPGEDPIGQRINLGNPARSPWRTIIGIVKDIRNEGLDREPYPQMYAPYAQFPRRSMTLVARAASAPLGLVPSIRRELTGVDQDQPLYNVRTMEQVMAESIARRRFNMLLITIFASVGLILAVVGVYGVISYSVTQRTHEIGIRLALGAQSKDVLKLVVKHGMASVFIGMSVGLVGAVTLTRVMESLIFGVSTTDPVTFTAVTALLTLVALLACYIPARRATKVDPMIALRYE